MPEELQPNAGKKRDIEVRGAIWARFPVRTHVIKNGDDIIEVCRTYAGPHLKPGDLMFISEKIVAISQGRAFPIKDIIPSSLAKLLVKFVHKSPHGIGLGSPWTMELAIREAGAPRMLLAAATAAFTKPFGIRGVFYRVAGKNINAIDGPCDYTLPPYNEYAKLGPAKPHAVAASIREALGHDIVIIDANDLGVNVLGKAPRDIPDELAAAIFKDNPLGQASEQTPICIVRKLTE